MSTIRAFQINSNLSFNWCQKIWSMPTHLQQEHIVLKLMVKFDILTEKERREEKDSDSDGYE